MAARGLQDIPFRVPEVWSAGWFREFIRDVLAKLDVRNALEGPGITISGTPDEVATLSSSEDLLDLIEQNFILATSSSFLANERILRGDPGIVSTQDDGPGGNFTIGIEPQGIGAQEFRDSAANSVVGRASAIAGSVGDIVASTDGDVLRMDSGAIGFGTIPSTSVADFAEAAQDAVGNILVDSATIDFTYTDATPSIAAAVIKQMSIDADASGIKLVNDELSPGNSEYYGTDSGGAKGYFPLPATGIGEATGSPTFALTGVTGTVTGTGYYSKIGNTVTLQLPQLTGTSNAGTCTITGLPVGITPARNQTYYRPFVIDNSVADWGTMYVGSDGVIRLAPTNTATFNFSGWTAGGTKGLNAAQTITYQLA